MDIEKLQIGNDTIKGVTELELLWENPNPTTEFEPKTIELALSQYKSFWIQWKVNDSITEYFDVYANAKDMTLGAIGYMDHFASIVARTFSVTDTGVVFGRATQIAFSNSQSTIRTNNWVALPYKIYGKK